MRAKQCAGRESNPRLYRYARIANWQGTVLPLYHRRKMQNEAAVGATFKLCVRTISPKP